MGKTMRCGALALLTSVMIGCGSDSSGSEPDATTSSPLDAAIAARDAATDTDASLAHDAAVGLDAGTNAGDASLNDGAIPSGDAAASDAGPISDGGSASSALTGTLGALGAVQPIVSALVVSNSGETLVYLSSAPLACSDVATSRWLGQQPAGSQVVELVVRGAPMVQTYAVGPAEVNYAPGGMSSAYEKSADSGSITFTTASANGPVAGSVMAQFAQPTGQLSGTFSAEFCSGGQQY